MLCVSRARTSHHIDLHFMRSRVIPESSSLVYTCIRRIPPPSSIFWGQLSERGGWDVRARALTCVALGRWVAFGASEDERLGTRWCTEPDAQSRMHFIIRTLFW